MIPAAIAGIVFNTEIEALFEGKLTFVGAMLILTGLLLFVANQAKSSTKNIKKS